MSQSWYGILHDCRICEAEPRPEPPSPWGQCEGKGCGIVDWLCEWCHTCERCDCRIEQHL